MSLARFKEAQDATRGGFAQALAELRAGEKRSHWIWYIFPQLAGLGQSAMAHRYGIASREEACDYLHDPELRARLQQATAAAVGHLERGVSLDALMGSRIDALKFVSSLTLFVAVAKPLAATDDGYREMAVLFERALALAEKQGFARCAFTLRAMARGGELE